LAHYELAHYELAHYELAHYELAHFNAPWRVSWIRPTKSTRRNQKIPRERRVSE
jgi:hypothetical protein